MKRLMTCVLFFIIGVSILAPYALKVRSRLPTTIGQWTHDGIFIGIARMVVEGVNLDGVAADDSSSTAPK